MTIAVQCRSCSTKLKVPDHLAGKRVKCPKCSQPFQIPGGPAAGAAKATGKKPIQRQAVDDGGYGLAAASNPMLELLSEAEVQSAPRGPVCNHCGADLAPLAIICVECGFNNETGKQLETTVGGGANQTAMSDADKIMARAEQEIDETPVSASEQDFGDGADSIVIALVALIGAAILVAIGVGIIFVMDKIGESVDTLLISMTGAVAMYLFCSIWITSVAFRAKPLHGLGCLLTGGLYAIVFGFMQGKTLLLPTLILIFSILIGLLSWAMSGGDENAMMLGEVLRTITIV